MPVSAGRLVGLLALAAQTALAASRLAARDGSGHGIPFTTTSGIGLTDEDVFDSAYQVNITLGGQQFTVQLDTGSSDLWVYAPGLDIKISNDSQLRGNITYGTGSVEGPIQFAELQVGEYSVPAQAFINAATLGANTPPGLVGILGIGFDSDNGSVVDDTLHTAWGENNTLGRTVMSNILAGNSSLAPFYDIALARALDIEQTDGETAGGAFVIGYHDPQYAAVAQAPQIARVVDDRWAGYLDGMAVNGVNISFPPSSVDGTPAGKLVALFDSGTSDLVIPGVIADAVFAQFEGAIKVNATWYVPCYSGANVTFSAGGQDFAVHPLDLSRVFTWTSTTPDGIETTFTLCQAAFEDATVEFGTLPGFDLVLGDVFLKNVLTSFNYGQNNREGDTPGMSGSFMQLLSTTDQDDAWVDFQETRSTILSLLYPAVIDPVFLPVFFPADFGSVQNSTGTGFITPFASDTPSPPSGTTTSAAAPAATSAPAPAATSRAAAAGALADLDTTSATPSPSPSANSSVTSLLDKYGPVVIGLLGANVFVMLLLCVIALVACTRGVMRSGARSRSAPTYVPVSFRDKPAAGYDPEENVRNYSD
ncbi:acid protease [Phanerochaete sordida]|uniref:Acid protease n=1 Tax=Phanerochaete sordida TaxID=48140 RepID=A0A9P3LGH4_9APHY|nr:acid protease [Phanerochaete sordida]